MARPRKKGERHPCGKLKQNHRSDLPTSLWRWAQEAITKLQLDQRFGSEIGKLRLGGDLTATENAPLPRSAETRPAPPKKLLPYDRSVPERDAQRIAAAASRAIEIIVPLSGEEDMCRLMVMTAIHQCANEEEVQSARIAAEDELGSVIRRIKGAENALDLRKTYKRLAFQDRDDFDVATKGAVDDLSRIRKRLQTLLDGYRERVAFDGVRGRTFRGLLPPHMLMPVSWRFPIDRQL
jgi:hypothetical protein